MEKILAIDASPLIYATFESVGHLATRQGEPTGLRYGFVRAVRSYQEKTKADKVVIAFDSADPNTKAQKLPGYKANRTFTEAKATMYAQVGPLREMLKLTKWTQIDAPGYEADDLIGAIARAKGQRGDFVTIASPDDDLMQLVRDNVRIFRAGSAKKKTKDRFITGGDVFTDYGVFPEHMCLYRAITGDVSDNLPGVLTQADVKRELRHLLNSWPRRNQPYTPDDLNAALEKFSLNSPLSALKEPANVQTIREHYHVMTLHTPPNANIHKGLRDRAKLEELFRKLEFNSMYKYLDELTDSVPVGAAA